ncbi:MAG: hypothetical protein IKN72_06870 [Clostridia bacterium]|nr:hypothetical protein [Clostridia bacterium]MBR3553094.1 hypothetical protein [Clostridia bacterium]
MAKIGIGSWAGKISVRLARGEVKFTISEDENGEYKIDTTLPGALKTAKIKFMNLKEEEDGKTLSGEGTISVLPGRKLTGAFTFEEDTFVGEIKAPVVGKIKITDGHRI